MVVGTLTIELFVGEASTLKDKRRVLKSIIDRVKAKFNVSIAEVDGHDIWQRSTLGVACVSNETAHAQSMLSNVAKFIENQGTAEIISISTEIL
ncbi:uncharacterized protein YlxP (DUF503 family) [Desulfohalotomaculum tongense]|uniref:DUF503 domain-containing protein n=1 Tax=Desulforadius tongensis TaxID=1216062 RepID=UPI00195B98C3|nr:DUF503 domain-containing protein [Desulforadius tongensis]MBM7855381.1 uncharacterized protein YlxP (DUF503 family) [Desulforadius tongensis]